MRFACVLAVSLFACGPSSKPTTTTTPPPAETGAGETGSAEPGPTETGSGSGTAPTEPGQCMCTMQYDPVCGADGKTYGNACAAGCAKVAVTAKGECPAS